MRVIPIKPVPNQNFTVVLDQDICKINIYVRGEHLYFDLTVGDLSITRSTICLNIVPLVKQEYLGFTGNFIFVDMHGKTDPVYQELGIRYKLIYFNGEESAELLKKTP
jgi:hypothetical protein